MVHGKGSWIWTGQHLPPPLYRAAHGAHEPPNTPAEISVTSQLNYLCQEVAQTALRTQRFGNLRAKVEGGGRMPEAL